MNCSKQRCLGMQITPQKDLGCEQRCATKLPVIRSAGLGGKGEAEGVFAGQKCPPAQWQAAEMVGCFLATSLGTGCDFNTQLYRNQPCHQARTVTSPLFFNFSGQDLCYPVRLWRSWECQSCQIGTVAINIWSTTALIRHIKQKDFSKCLWNW